MKITEYGRLNRLNNDNVFLVDGPSGTKTITKSDLVYDLFDGIPQMHNQIWRGKNLGTRITQEQLNEIKNGTFHDLWLGDYWTVENHDQQHAGFNKNQFTIMHFDYFTVPDSPHHIVIMPRYGFDRSAINPVIDGDASLSGKGLLGSDLIKNKFPTYLTELGSVLNAMGVPSATNDHLLTVNMKIVSDINYNTSTIVVAQHSSRLWLPTVTNISAALSGLSFGFWERTSDNNATLSLYQSADTGSVHSREFAASKYIKSWYWIDLSHNSDLKSTDILTSTLTQVRHNRIASFGVVTHQSINYANIDWVVSIHPYFCLK